MKVLSPFVVLALFAGTLASCSSGSIGDTASAGGPAPSVATEIVVTWTFDGKPASVEECAGRGAKHVYLNLSGTVDPALHQTETLDCARGGVTFSKLTV